MPLVANIAELEQHHPEHHPDLHLTNYREVKIEKFTRKINGLTRND